MILPWFLRVASPSNIADFPSRLQRHPLLKNQKMIAHNVVLAAFQYALEFVFRPHKWLGGIHGSERWMAVWLQFSSGKKHCIPMLLFVVFRVFSCPHVYLFTCAVWLFSNVRCLRCDCVTHFRLWHVFRLLTMGSVLYVFTSYYGVAPMLLDPCFLCVRK